VELDGHRVQDVARLVRGGLERGADEVLAARPAGEARDQPAGVGLPVRRAEPRERGHEVDAAVVVDGVCELSALGGVREQAEAVAQPLHRRARDEDRALERVLRRLSVEPRRGGADEACRRRTAVGSGVREHEAPRAVRGLRASRGERAVTGERGLLVASDPGDRDGRAEQLGLAHDRARRTDLRQQRAVDAEQREQLVVPVERGERREQRTRRVRLVGRVDAAARELPDEPAVDGAEGETLWL
jgi:hypothetical protein